MEEETFDSKINPCGVGGTRVMYNSVLCTACGKRIQARCTNKKKVAVHLNKNFDCKKCRDMVKNFKGPDKIWCDGVKTVSQFFCLGDRLNATGGCKTAVTATTRIGLNKSIQCSKILKGRRFSDEREGLQKLRKISFVVWK